MFIFAATSVILQLHIQNEKMKLFFYTLLLLIPLTGISQSNEIKIKFIGNCGLYFTDGDLHLYSDFPYKSGAFNYMEYDAAELDSIQKNSVFLFTHKHADHYSKKLLKKAIKTHQGQAFGAWNIDALKQLCDTIPEFEIQAFKNDHRFSSNHYSYLIIWHGKKIFLSGDTESAATIANMKNLDWAFVPYWILYDAEEMGFKIDTKKIGLYHLYPDQKINGEIPEKLQLMDQQGKTISIPF